MLQWKAQNGVLFSSIPNQVLAEDSCTYNLNTFSVNSSKQITPLGLWWKPYRNTVKMNTAIVKTWSIWRLCMFTRPHPEMNDTWVWKLGTDWCDKPLSACCDQFSGRCLRRASQSRVTSYLISGCHDGLTWRIPQHGSSAITQRISSNWVEIWDVRTVQISDCSWTFCVVGLVSVLEVRKSALIIIPICMHISLACPGTLPWGSSQVVCLASILLFSPIYTWISQVVSFHKIFQSKLQISEKESNL